MTQDPDLEHQLLGAADDYAKSGQYTAGNLPAAPSKRLTIVTCMDARIDVFTLFNLPLGSAHVIRNAGGLASYPSTMRSLIISQQFLGTRTILILKHTNCGMAMFTPSDAQEKIYRDMGPEAAKRVYEVVGRKWGCFKDVENECRRDVKALVGETALVKGTRVVAWIFDVKTGTVKRVDGAEGVVGEQVKEVDGEKNGGKANWLKQEEEL